MTKLSSTKPDFASLVQSKTVRPLRRNLSIQLKKTVRVHAFLLVIIAWYAVACLATAWIFDTTQKMSLSLYSKNLGVVTFAFLVVFFCGRATYIMIFIRPKHLTRYIMNDLKGKYLTCERIAMGLPILLFFPVFASTFTSLKTMIPDINPYSWDPLLAQWDAALHGGHQPWLLLQPFLGHPFVTSVVNFFYNLWFFVMYGGLLWQTFSLRNPRLRMQFLLAFVASWALLGNVAAMLFSSAGPCYYGRITGLVDPFQPLMNYLWAASESFPVWSLNVQEMLWEAYGEGGIGFGSGISAMPSMHVSVVFLLTLVGWRTSRAHGIGFTAFTMLIIIGSVHLGWHYAIDDYAALIGTWLIWRAVGWLLNRYAASLNL